MGDCHDTRGRTDYDRATIIASEVTAVGQPKGLKKYTLAETSVAKRHILHPAVAMGEEPAALFYLFLEARHLDVMVSFIFRTPWNSPS